MNITRFIKGPISKQLARFKSTIGEEKKKIYYKMSHDRFGDFSQQQNRMYFGTEVINRVSFLREDSDFISNAVSHPLTRFVFFHDTNPLVHKVGENKLVVLTNGNEQLESGEGDGFKVGLKNHEEWNQVIETWKNDNKEQSSGLRDDEKPTLLFLGLKDESVGLNLSKVKAADIEKEDEDHEINEHYLDHQGRYQGIPYFAVDLTQSPKLVEMIKTFFVEENSQSVNKSDLFFSLSRKHYFGFNDVEATLYSHGKMFLDWLGRNRFCPGCGSKVIPIHAGGKLHCTNDKHETYKEEGETKTKYDCPVKNKRVSNVSFPRTDAVVITAITNQDKSKILLSKLKRYAPTNIYACTAGFLEPSETVEVATKREIWEETGVVCLDIKIFMTQPWPFPANLMIGCIATVDFNGINEQIYLGHDRELADAQWFDTDFVKKLIYDDPGTDANPDGITLPTPESIAYQLIKAVADQPKASKF